MDAAASSQSCPPQAVPSDACTAVRCVSNASVFAMPRPSARLSRHQSSLLKTFKANAALFLAYCCLARALRNEHHVRRGLPAIVAVMIAEGLTSADVGHAADLFVQESSYEVLNLTKMRRTGSRPILAESDLDSALRRSRLLVIAESVQTTPEARLGASDVP